MSHAIETLETEIRRLGVDCAIQKRKIAWRLGPVETQYSRDRLASNCARIRELRAAIRAIDGQVGQLLAISVLRGAIQQVLPTLRRAGAQLPCLLVAQQLQNVFDSTWRQASIMPPPPTRMYPDEF